MDTQLEETLNSILTKSIELAEKSGEFIIEQGGDLLQEFYMWYTAQHILGIILAVAFLAFAIITDNKCRVARKDDFENWEPGVVVPWIFITIFGGIAGIILLGNHIYYLCFITIAPKLYLLDHFIN